MALRLPIGATARVRPYKIQNVFLNIYKGRTLTLHVVNGQGAVKVIGQPERILVRLGEHSAENYDRR
jgi:hypothetical protein